MPLRDVEGDLYLRTPRGARGMPSSTNFRAWYCTPPSRARPAGRVFQRRLTSPPWSKPGFFDGVDVPSIILLTLVWRHADERSIRAKEGNVEKASPRPRRRAARPDCRAAATPSSGLMPLKGSLQEFSDRFLYRGVRFERRQRPYRSARLKPGVAHNL
jgi:hypothetical protein